ncbi:ribonuclease R [Corallococcus sp. Z5C101001]|uniref:ribonuclease R n=1 Tax=Corallococcus sp. Z5C101001 TaxID=2596829 RepID=UPI0011800CB7|nr:ribonuclease R [Corallococcus sp. Z5C101001]TSC26015.1 ribonuclease R [Corallococcus sp. Z5C101001]
MSLSQDHIRQLLAEADHPLGVKELLRVAGLNPGQQTELKRALRELVRSGAILKEGKRFRLEGPRVPRAPDADADLRRAPSAPPFKKRGPAPGSGREERRGGFRDDGPGGAPFRRSLQRGSRDERFTDSGIPEVEGILHMHRDGFGFVHPVTGEGENIFLPPGEAQRALDNDRVLVEVAGRPGRYEGRLLRVVNRRRELAVGTYVAQGRHSVVLPTDANLPGPIRVPATQMARDGDLVKVRLGVGADLLDPGQGLFGEVAGSLGRPGEPSAEVLGSAFSQGFSDEFPPEVMDEADAFAVRVSEAEATEGNRRDLRSLPLITIDGEDARDFDDAVYAEPKAGGWRLVVAIADVSHYVRERSALDAEALNRATSVYLPDRVLPMLPERLSNGICSLRPDEDRLCMVADMTFDRHGQRRSHELYPAVMRSVARCTYNEVQDVLDGTDVPHRNFLKPQFEELMALARALMGMRKARGAIDFDVPEHKVLLGEDGLPLRMEKRERKDSHRLIEECMLAANEAVATYFQDEGLPTVYRFHGEPDPQKLAAFAVLAEAYGFHLEVEDGVSSKELDAFITQLEGHPEQRALNQLLLRSMMQAVYTSTRVGHYGLAAENYLHFTSPIRRYPDLLVHRILKAVWARKGKRPSDAQLEREEERLEGMAQQCSERERAAMTVEREVVAFYAALMMKDRVGEEFDATVAGIADFGFFVELDEVHVEGLVKAETLGPGSKLDKRTHSLVYANGRRVRVGQKLRVRLLSANTTSRKIDFEALQFENEAPLPRAAGARPPSRRREYVNEAPVRHQGGRHERPGRPGRHEREAAKAGRTPWKKPAGADADGEWRSLAEQEEAGTRTTDEALQKPRGARSGAASWKSVTAAGDEGRQKPQGARSGAASWKSATAASEASHRKLSGPGAEAEPWSPDAEETPFGVRPWEPPTAEDVASEEAASFAGFGGDASEEATSRPRPRGRFSREGRREEAAPARTTSRFPRAKTEDVPTPKAEPSAPAKGKRRVIRPARPASGEDSASTAGALSPSEDFARPGQDSEEAAPSAAPGLEASPFGDDTAPAASPHPGFDRIRALAAQRGQLTTGGAPGRAGASKKVRKAATGAAARSKPSKKSPSGKKTGGSKGASKKPGRGAPGKRKR